MSVRAKAANAKPLASSGENSSYKSSLNHPERNSSGSTQATYEPLQVLGRGSFGVVMMARVRETGRTVAIKKVLFDGRLHHRELMLLRDYLGPQKINSVRPQITDNNNDCMKINDTLTTSTNNNSQNRDKNDINNETKPLPLGDIMASPTILSYHPNIVQLKDHFSACGSNGEQYLYIVMDYLPLDIHHLQNMYVRQKKQRMPMIFVKITIFQLARALTFLHSRGICHRDVKPGNLLIDPETGIVKLCDFGSAKAMQPLGYNGPREKNVSYICSRYYRAPELLFGSLYYHFHVDMWAVGCVLAELLCGQVLFKGDSTVDQMAEIFKVLGAPSSQELFALNPQSAEALLHSSGAYLGGGSTLPPVSNTSINNTSSNTNNNNNNNNNSSSSNNNNNSNTNNNNNNSSSDYLQRYHALRIKALQWQSVLPPNTPPSAISLVGQLLRYTPAERLSAGEVLEHPFFDDIFSEDTRLPNGAPLPVNMFQVTEEESETLPAWLLERMASAEIAIKKKSVLSE